jgi:hypothetical protein
MKIPCAIRLINLFDGAKKVVPAIVGRPAIDENFGHEEIKISQLEPQNSWRLQALVV